MHMMVTGPIAGAHAIGERDTQHHVAEGMGHRGMPRFMDGDEYSVLDRVRPPGCARPLAYSRSIRERELQPCPVLVAHQLSAFCSA